MGMLVECDGVTVWDAGMVSARLFAGQVRLLEDVFGLDSGMIGPDADFLYVDAQRWREFARALLEQLARVDSQVPHVMVAGIVQLVLIVDARASGVWLDVPPRFVHLRHGAEGLQHSMGGDLIAIGHHPCARTARG
ncbi:DUF6086 family protein [Catellatospora aurea]|uniref:DUF6086 family protein n=1 Tax=Catellatospora aurea TaxID=1337874 RepID=A0ABW2GX39_9ACTN